MTWAENPVNGVHSYRVNDATGQYAGTTGSWSSPPLDGYEENASIFATENIAAWIGIGVATSQVYDTKLSAPAYEGLSWGSILPPGASILVKVRTSANANMAGAADWDLLGGYASSPASLSSLPSARYVQFQATLLAASPYTAYPTLDNLKITWPGQSALVELGGYFTQRPYYGVFKVLVDGKQTVKALEVGLSASKTYRSQVYDASLNAEIKPRNTGK